jgi:type II secretory pathway component PulF
VSESFIYTARTRNGEARGGIIVAENPERVAAILFEQNLFPTSIKAQKKEIRPFLFGFLKARQYEDLILFTRNFATLYRAGIPMLKALTIIKVGPPKSYFNRAIEKIRSSVQSGRALSDAMSDFPDIFSKIFISSVAAGEASGKLDEILDSLAKMLENDLELNRQIKSALRYPIIVICTMALAFIVLMTLVIPRFMQFYSSVGAELPAPTLILIWLNKFLSQYWILVLAALGAAALGLKKIYSSNSGRLFFDTRFLKMPVFGDLIVKGNIARFAYMFHILLKSGIPLIKALELLANTVKNSRLTSEIKLMADSFREGREISDLPSRLQFFPEMALQMIKIGLESGAVEKMLDDVAIHYSREVDYKTRQLTALLQPILTVVLGGFVLLVALAIFLPMWNLIQVFKG